VNRARPSIAQTLLRLALVLGVTWAIARTFLYLLPGDPAEYLAHETLVDIAPDTLRARMELDQPWTRRLLSFPRAESLITGRPVWTTIREAFFRSVTLTALTLTVFAFLTLLLLYGSYRSPRIRRLADSLSVAIASTPLFILGPVLLLALSLKLNWFPVSHSPFLPALTLAIYLTGFWYRTLARRMDRYQPLSAIPGARARGLGELRIFLRYLLIPTLGSYFGFLGSQIGTLLNGSVLIEMIFQWNGLGSLLTDAVLSRDYPLVEGALLLITLVTLFCLQVGYWAQSRWEEKLS
jgi:peptide/nickel transport system permease protein